MELRGLPSKSSKLMNAENPDVDIKDNSALNSIHRSAEPRNLDLAPDQSLRCRHHPTPLTRRHLKKV